MTQTSLFARWGDHQLTRMELIFSSIVIFVLLSIFLNQMFVIMARAERTLVHTSIVNINSTLRMYRLHKQLKNEPEQINAMQNANPVRLLEHLPKTDDTNALSSNQLAEMLKARSAMTLQNYVGELVDTNAAEGLDSGSWYFDLENNALVYIIRSSELFRSELPGRARLRYQLQLDYTDQNQDGQYTADIDDFIAIGLQSLDEHKWLL